MGKIDDILPTCMNACVPRALSTIATVLYPPFLDESGLLAAIRWFANGFGERSGVDVVLDLPDALERFSQDMETTLFRAVQEALMNIHPHANSSDATIRLRRDRDDIRQEIQDHGRGMPADALAVRRAPAPACWGLVLPEPASDSSSLEGGSKSNRTAVAPPSGRSFLCRGPSSAHAAGGTLTDQEELVPAGASDPESEPETQFDLEAVKTQ